MRTFNIKETYVDEDDLWLGILEAAAAFPIIQTTNRVKGYHPHQLVFGCDMILLIRHEE